MALSVEHVTKRFGSFTALEDITLSFTPGVYGLLAPNGAGKTTLIKLLTTLLFPTQGQILWEGEDIFALGADYRALLGYLPQQFGYYPSYSPRRFLGYTAALQCLPKAQGARRAEELLALVGLSEAMDKPMKTFSGGMLQRVGIAAAMLTDPALLILDEPTAGLDPRGRDVLLAQIAQYHKERGNTVLLVSHSMEDVGRVADRLLVMNAGQLLALAPTKEVFSRGEELERVGLRVPQITKIMGELQKLGLPVDPSTLTVDGALQQLIPLLKERRNPHAV